MNLLLCILGISLSHAAVQKQNGFLLKTIFEYKANNKITKSESSFILDAKNKTWTTLTPPKDGITLLGRMMDSNAKSIGFEYIVVNTNEKNSVISTPQMIARIGENATLEMNIPNKEKISISLMASPTEYESAKSQ